MGSLPADSKWSMGKTKQINNDKTPKDPKYSSEYADYLRQSINEKLPEDQSLADTKAEVENQVAQSAEDQGIMSKEEALANIQKGKEAAHGDENLKADKNPLVNGEEDISVTPTKPGQQEAKEEAKKDPQTRWKMKSIMQAYYDGDFGEPGSPEAKSNRNYLLADTVSTFLRNTGHNTSEDSIWGRRNKEMASSAIEGEKAGVSGSREQREYDTWASNQLMRYFNNLSAQERLNMASQMDQYINNAPNDTIRLKYMDIKNKMLQGGRVDETDLAFSGVGELWNKLSSKLSS